MIKQNYFQVYYNVFNYNFFFLKKIKYNENNKV